MPQKKQKSLAREVRYIAAPSANFEVRKGADGTPTTIIGYAAKFAPNRSEDLGGWVEEIDPKAFDRSIQRKDDVRGLFNHDPSHILGRTKAGTLRLSVDSTGLRYEIDPPDTQYAKDLMKSMERGDVDQSSFGFICNKDDWRVDSDGTAVRTLLDVTLVDVSPVTYPAYLGATSGVRSFDALFPDGNADVALKIAELRASRKKKDNSLDDIIDDDVDDSDDEDDEDDEEDRSCECDCPECLEGDHDECSNLDCDSDCEGCPQQDDQRSDLLRMRSVFQRLMQ